MPPTENSPAADGNGSRKGLSKEAWVAISTISAALITGIVTLIINLAPQKPAANPALVTSSPAVTVTPAQMPHLVTADEIAGKWSGDGTDSTGQSFQITLDVRKACGINERCGSISVSHIPCYGEIFLEKARDRLFEFRVDNFYGDSDRANCQPGPGETFQLRPDGKLDYNATYEPTASGVLERQDK